MTGRMSLYNTSLGGFPGKMLAFIISIAQSRFKHVNYEKTHAMHSLMF